MLNKGPSQSVLEKIKRDVEKDSAIKSSAESSRAQENLMYQLLEYAESAEKSAEEASKHSAEALETAAQANFIAIISIIISGLLAIAGVIATITTGVLK